MRKATKTRRHLDLQYDRTLGIGGEVSYPILLKQSLERGTSGTSIRPDRQRIVSPRRPRREEPKEQLRRRLSTHTPHHQRERLPFASRSHPH